MAKFAANGMRLVLRFYLNLVVSTAGRFIICSGLFIFTLRFFDSLRLHSNLKNLYKNRVVTLE